MIKSIRILLNLCIILTWKLGDMRKMSKWRMYTKILTLSRLAKSEGWRVDAEKQTCEVGGFMFI